MIGTLVYLTPAADLEDTLTQVVGGQQVLRWQLPSVRLWQQDADAALASGSLGLAVLSPLMAGASDGLIEQATALVLREAPQPQQADLLSILGVFAEPFMDKERFVRLMESDLLTYLMEEKTIELEQHYIQRTAELEQTLQQTLEQTLEEVLIARFPDAPVSMLGELRQVRDPARLQRLVVAVAGAASLAEFRQTLAHMVATLQEGLPPH